MGLPPGSLLLHALVSYMLELSGQIILPKLTLSEIVSNGQHVVSSIEGELDQDIHLTEWRKRARRRQRCRADEKAFGN